MQPSNIIEKEVIPGYFDAGKVREVMPLGAGLINDTLVLTTSEPTARYIIQKINKQVFREPSRVMDNLILILDHLKTRAPSPVGFPELVPTREGDLCFIDSRKDYWRIFPYIEHTRNISLIENPEQARQASRAFGTYIRHLADLDPGVLQETIDHFHDYRKRVETLEQSIREDPEERVIRCRQEIDEVERRLSYIESFFTIDLPTRIVHSDAKIDNVLFEENSDMARAVIDLDISMPASLLYDYGDMIRSYTSTVREDDDRFDRIDIQNNIFSALTSGFLSETRHILTPEEEEHLLLGGKVVILVQAIRFLTDFIQGDIYYKTGYPDHNLIRTRNQLALLKALEKGEKQLTRIIRYCMGSA